MEAFNLAQLTKEMVVGSIRELGDPAQVTARVVHSTLLARLKGRSLPDHEVQEAAVETCRGAMAGMVLTECPLPRGAAAILAAVPKTAREAGVDDRLVAIAGIEGMADVKRFTTPEVLGRISQRLEEVRRGAGAAFDRLCADGGARQRPDAEGDPEGADASADEQYAGFEQLLYLVAHLNRRAIESRALTEFWPILAESLTSQFGCERASLFLLKDGKLRSEFAVGLEEHVELEVGQGMAGFVIQQGKSIRANDPYKDPRFDPSIDRKTGYKTKNILVSAFYHKGRAVGIVELLSKEGGFTRDDARTLEWLSPHVGFLLYEMDLADEKRRLDIQVAQASKMADLGFLVAGVVHDLSHPVMNLLTGAELLRQTAPPDSPLRGTIRRMEKSARSCEATLRHLMDLARGDEFKLEEVSLEEVLRETLELVDTQARMNKVAVRAELQPDLPKVLAAKNPLRRVFLNLFVNALHAMPEPEGGTLTVSAHTEGGRVRMRVEDTGIGIDPEHLPRLFEKFFTTRGQSGTGLGLSICRDIVEKCGGSLEAHSEGRGKGAVFAVCLPVRPGSRSAGELVSASGTSAPSRATRGPAV
ncbi:MAG: GAF domain-containing sensor histidine kinase [Elusimicrobiota bacterium]